MLHPSYTEIMSKVNSDVEEGNEPVVNSRYSIVIATAKRARQLIGGAEALVKDYGQKPLSIAVEELYDGKIKIMPESTDDEDEVEEIAGEEAVEALETEEVEEAAEESKEESEEEEAPVEATEE